jgi:hypothetical protein
MRAMPGEVAFAEAYLSWSQEGLALATIGQDYYDVDLLAYDGPFPLGEAYRLKSALMSARAYAVLRWLWPARGGQLAQTILQCF